MEPVTLWDFSVNGPGAQVGDWGTLQTCAHPLDPWGAAIHQTAHPTPPDTLRPRRLSHGRPLTARSVTPAWPTVGRSGQTWPPAVWLSTGLTHFMAGWQTGTAPSPEAGTLAAPRGLGPRGPSYRPVPLQGSHKASDFSLEQGSDPHTVSTSPQPPAVDRPATVGRLWTLCPQGPVFLPPPSPAASQLPPSLVSHPNSDGTGTAPNPAIHCSPHSQFSSVQSLSRVQLFATPWTAARQASLSLTIFQSLLKLTSIESLMPSNHLSLCCPLLLPSVFPSIREAPPRLGPRD